MKRKKLLVISTIMALICCMFYGGSVKAYADSSYYMVDYSAIVMDHVYGGPDYVKVLLYNNTEGTISYMASSIGSGNEEADPKIVYLKHTPGAVAGYTPGYITAENYGLDHASYKYVKFVEYPVPRPSNGANTNTNTHTHQWKYGTIYNATEDTDGLEGEYCSCGAIKNTTVIPSGDAIINNNYAKIDAAKAGQSIVINMKTMCNLSNAFMKRIAAKNDCSFTIRLIYKNKAYEFYIPAGTQFDTDLEYYGTECLMGMFEYKQLN